MDGVGYGAHHCPDGVWLPGEYGLGEDCCGILNQWEPLRPDRPRLKPLLPRDVGEFDPGVEEEGSRLVDVPRDGEEDRHGAERVRRVGVVEYTFTPVETCRLRGGELPRDLDDALGGYPRDLLRVLGRVLLDVLH